MIEILSHNFDLEYVESRAWTGSLGKCSLNDNTILIKDGLPEDTERSTVIHEAIHIIADLQGIEMRESEVCAMATGVHSFLNNNKKFIDRLYKFKESI